MYNAQISSSPPIYVIADNVDHRGPGAFCNDNTVVIHCNQAIQPTGKQANAKLTWTIPYDDYLDDWANYKNDGTQFNMYVELVNDVQCGEEIFVCYGEDTYWKNDDGGTRMSNAIVIDE